MKKNINKLIILVLLFFFIPCLTYADDELLEENVFFENAFISTSSNQSDEPIINARHAVVFDRNSKTFIYGKKGTDKCKMASTTKIMTAIVVIENSNLNDIVTISSKSALTGGSRLGLSKNDKISVKHLLYGLLLKSGNDAAVALAEHVGGTLENFAFMMNNKAKLLNLSNTNFVTPHGLDDDNHYTTAIDLAILSDYALKNDFFAKIVKTKSYTVSINNISKTISNTNELLGNFEGIYGIKTGFTNGANRCLITSCKRGNLDFICIVLGCDTKKDRTRDSLKLLNYAFNNFSLVNVEKIIKNEFNNWYISHQNSFCINKGTSQNLDLFLDEADFLFQNIAVKKSEHDKISVEISFSPYLDAPVSFNKEIGKIILLIDNNEYYSVNILSKNHIEKKWIYDYLLIIFRDYTHFFKKSPII